MLSRMLHQHPKVLSLSEFFSMVSDAGGRIPALFPDAPVSGQAFWELITAVTPQLTTTLRHDASMAEIIYPFGSDAARYTRQTGVPAISLTALSQLSGDPDALLESLYESVSSRPEANIADHYSALFDQLRERYSKRMWVERSGGAFVIIKEVAKLFPNARYIHIVRDGRDTACSMQNHVGFRIFGVGTMLTRMLGIQPFYDSDRSNIDHVPELLRAFLPENFDGEAFRNYRIPLDACGGLWSQAIANGMEVLRGLDEDRLLTLRYEDFLTDPKLPLVTLAAFLGAEYENHEWVETCAVMVRRPRSDWRTLSADIAATLDAVCRPGLALLHEIGIDYT
jgi:putative sulfotransferase